MSVIKKAISDLLESDKKYPPYGHDIEFYVDNHPERIYISSGVSDGYPIYLFLEKSKLSEDQVSKLTEMKLENAKEPYLRDFKNVRIVAEIELKEDYIESLIKSIFKDVFNIRDLSEVRYNIYPI